MTLSVKIFQRNVSQSGDFIQNYQVMLAVLDTFVKKTFKAQCYAMQKLKSVITFVASDIQKISSALQLNYIIFLILLTLGSLAVNVPCKTKVLLNENTSTQLFNIRALPGYNLLIKENMEALFLLGIQVPYIPANGFV